MPHSPEAYWTSYEDRAPVRSLSDLLDHIQSVADLSSSTMWRGVANHRWGLHSSLFRHMVDGGQDPPGEPAFMEKEKEIVELARKWGLDRTPTPLSGLELLAKLQHTGTPTRLIDATHDPLVGAWFATSMAPRPEPLPDDYAEPDGRLFALDYTNRVMNDTRHPDPIWHRSQGWSGDLNNSTSVWTPPSLDPRMSAQSGAFLVGQIPIRQSGGQWYNRGESTSRYTNTEIRQLTSVPIRAYATIEPGATYRQNPFISVRIAADAKRELRESLQSAFNLSAERLFPDVFGLGDYVRGTLSPPSA